MAGDGDANGNNDDEHCDNKELLPAFALLLKAAGSSLHTSLLRPALGRWNLHEAAISIRCVSTSISTEQQRLSAMTNDRTRSLGKNDLRLRRRA